MDLSYHQLDPSLPIDKIQKFHIQYSTYLLHPNIVYFRIRNIILNNYFIQVLIIVIVIMVFTVGIAIYVVNLTYQQKYQYSQ